MKSMIKFLVGSGVVIGIILTMSTVTLAQRGGGRGGGGRGGGGGARASMGHVGGGGGRPSMGGGGMSNFSRPSPNISRPSPSFSGGNRPSVGNVSRPNMSHPSARPSLPAVGGGGGFNPSGSSRPNINLPSVNPGSSGIASRPSVRPPANLRPTTRPSLPSGGLPGGNRPTTLPGIANRPGAGINSPNFGNLNRPTTLPGSVNRPSIGGGGNNRPVIGGGNNSIIGGGGKRPGIGNGINTGNLNIGNDINIGSGNGNRFGNGIGNRGGNFATTLPAWDRPGYNKPGWGLGGPGNGNWAGNWHDHCINNHHGWYNGCWNHGYWGSNWYRPLAWASVGWGLNSLTSGWGYGGGYYNPYYSAPVAAVSVPYDYSQPVVVNNYIPTDGNVAEPSTQVTQQTTESPESLSTFDQGLSQFKSGNYQQALATFDISLKQLPNDPVVHEVRALTLYAMGQYTPAAASLNSLLSSAPGMDWTTMSSLYGNTDDYTTQLRALEQYCKSNQNDAAAAFVLAYHYLILGAKDNAANALKVVVRNQPKDATAKRMLDALTPPSPTLAAAAPSDGATASTDLVGNWRAKAGDTTVDLSIADDASFDWKATPVGQPPIELKGQLTADSDAIVLVNEKQGSMAGTVKSLGADKWQFVLDGAPTNDPGLSFTRIRKAP